MVDFFPTMDSEDYNTDSVYIKGIVFIKASIISDSFYG
jgi:hypothetical protein